MTDNYIYQLPGELNLEMTDDNDLVFSIDWGMNLTGYSFEAFIIPENAEDEIEIDVTVTSYTSGTMNITIAVSDIADLPPSTNRWYLNWTTPSPDNYVRTILAGALVLRCK